MWDYLKKEETPETVLVITKVDLFFCPPEVLISMKKCCKGCCYLKGENEIGLGYCEKRSEILFVDQGCQGWSGDRSTRELWVSYDEKGLEDCWKIGMGNTRPLSVYEHRPVLDQELGCYIDPVLSEETEGRRATKSQENFIGDEIENDETLIALFPEIQELSGTNDLYRVTIEKIKG